MNGVPGYFDDPALRAVLTALPGARVVGGAVRDWLAGRPVADVDLATALVPEAVMRALSEAGLKHVPTGLQHGTVTAISGGRGFEVTTLRRDERTDGRHAEVSWTADWREDAARRDFTFNAMSMLPDGTLFDYFGGEADLRAGRVRFVGDAAARIAEDYLRVLRFFRFWGRYGAGPLEGGTAGALQSGAAGLGRLSPERVWSELKGILGLVDPCPAVGLMAELGVLAVVLGGDGDVGALRRLVGLGAPGDVMLRLAALCPGVDGERFRFSKLEAVALAGLTGAAPDAGWDDDGLRRALVETAPEVWVGRAWLAGGDAGVLARLTGMARPVFPLQGRDGMALGMVAGPALGVALAGVRAWWMAGGCVADRGACLAELARLAGS